jgi:hypothetical protein
VWSDLVRVIAEAGVALVGPLVRALREGDANKAAQAARVVAETIAFKRIIKKAARR